MINDLRQKATVFLDSIQAPDSLKEIIRGNEQKQKTIIEMMMRFETMNRDKDVVCPVVYSIKLDDSENAICLIEPNRLDMVKSICNSDIHIATQGNFFADSANMWDQLEVFRRIRIDQHNSYIITLYAESENMVCFSNDHSWPNNLIAGVSITREDLSEHLTNLQRVKCKYTRCYINEDCVAENFGDIRYSLPDQVIIMLPETICDKKIANECIDSTLEYLFDSNSSSVIRAVEIFGGNEHLEIEKVQMIYPDNVSPEERSLWSEIYYCIKKYNTSKN